MEYCSNTALRIFSRLVTYCIHIIDLSLAFGKHCIDTYLALCRSTDLVGPAADALLPLILCEQSVYQVAHNITSCVSVFVFSTCLAHFFIEKNFYELGNNF